MERFSTQKQIYHAYSVSTARSNIMSPTGMIPTSPKIVFHDRLMSVPLYYLF